MDENLLQELIEAMREAMVAAADQVHVRVAHERLRDWELLGEAMTKRGLVVTKQ